MEREEQEWREQQERRVRSLRSHRAQLTTNRQLGECDDAMEDRIRQLEETVQEMSKNRNSQNGE